MNILLCFALTCYGPPLITMLTHSDFDQKFHSLGTRSNLIKINKKINK